MHGAVTTKMSRSGALTRRDRILHARDYDRKSLSPLMNLLPPGLASGLLFPRSLQALLMTLGTLFIATGCIIPQEQDVLEPLPARKNRPVRIVPSTVTPADSRVELENVCDEVEFIVAVEDPDVDDIIRADFYIDYDRTLPNPLRFSQDILPTSNTAIRPTAARRRFTSDEPNIPLFTVGNHTVEVLVTDTSLDESRAARPALTGPDGGVLDEGYTDSFTWFITTVSGTCPQ